MRPIAVLLVVAALSIVPRVASAQVSVTSPAAGAVSSYRTAVIKWNPIAGASSYHLEIDDDPNFGSPEVDVTVAGTSYTMSGQRLKLYGQQSWAAYVRINGTRWNANAFTPSYFQTSTFPKATLATDSTNRAYLGFVDADGHIQLMTSSDWSSKLRLSLSDTVGANGFLNLAVDENDVAHASWLEHADPYYANSLTGWNRVRLPGTITGGSCSEGSLVAGGGQVDVFYDDCDLAIVHWTGRDGVPFTRTTIPNNSIPASASAARDGFGNLYVASERYTQPLEGVHSLLQASADGWNPHLLGPGRFPSIAVTPTGELHALRWGWEGHEDGLNPVFLYSNSLRNFQTWTQIPGAGLRYFDQDLLPLVVDNVRSTLHAAMPSPTGIQLCSALHTGVAASTGASWTCRSIGVFDALGPDLALAPDGTLHLAWTSQDRVGYANSLGSFLATNFTPKVSLGTASSTATAISVPASISDADGDDLAGHIHVGRAKEVVSVVQPQTTVRIVDGGYELKNYGTSLGDPTNTLQFRKLGARDGIWHSHYSRASPQETPMTLEVRRESSGDIIGIFSVLAWDYSATISQINFDRYVKITFSGALPDAVDISALPDGDAMLAVSASDWTTAGFAAQPFTKTAGQTRLLLTKP